MNSFKKETVSFFTASFTWTGSSAFRWTVQIYWMLKTKMLSKYIIIKHSSTTFKYMFFATRCIIIVKEIFWHFFSFIGKDNKRPTLMMSRHFAK